MSEIMSCPSCNAKFGGMFNSNQLKSKDLTESLNFILNRKNEHYCNECAKSPIEEVKSVLENNKHTFREKIKEGISSVPTISIQAPPKWDFDVIGLVTGQSTTGTGILSELTSSFTDLFGTQSKTYNTKLKA